MDKETLSNYGWIVICVLVLAVMLALATPFGTFIADGFKATYTGLFQTGDSALDVGLSAVGVSNKLPCGHDRKEAGDHTQKECGHYNCQDTECGCVPASCGVEGHWSGDGKDHTTVVNHTGHTYACQCSGWVVPEGGTYKLSNGTVYNAGEQLPCNHNIWSTEVFTYGDYKYIHYSSKGGWEVSLNLDVTDKNKATYGEILKTINGAPVTSLNGTFRECTSMTSVPAIPETVTHMYGTFYGCTLTDLSSLIIPSGVKDLGGTFRECKSLVVAPDISHCALLTNLDYTFYGCESLISAPEMPQNVKSLVYTFVRCTSLKTYVGSTDADGDFSGYKIPNSVTVMERTFGDCENLVTAPEIPNNVTNMSSTFANCTSLTTAPIIPSSVTDLASTFAGCWTLTGTVSAPCIATTNSSTVPTALGKATLEFYHVDGCDASCGK